MYDWSKNTLKMQQSICLYSVEAALHQEYYVLLITERISWASDTNSVTVILYDDSDDSVIVIIS